MGAAEGAALGSAWEGAAVPPVEPGAEHHVAVSFAAPGEPGRYVSYWRLRGPGGRRFGHRLWVDVCVPRVPPGVADGIGAAMANVATLVGQKAKKALGKKLATAVRPAQLSVRRKAQHGCYS